MGRPIGQHVGGRRACGRGRLVAVHTAHDSDELVTRVLIVAKATAAAVELVRTTCALSRWLATANAAAVATAYGSGDGRGRLLPMKARQAALTARHTLCRICSVGRCRRRRRRRRR